MNIIQEKEFCEIKFPRNTLIFLWSGNKTKLCWDLQQRHPYLDTTQALGQQRSQCSRSANLCTRGGITPGISASWD